MKNLFTTALTGILLLLAGHAEAQTGITYIERSWDAEAKQVVAQQKTTSSYLELKNSMLNNGWLGVGSDYGDNYKWCVVDDKLEVLTLNVQGEAHLILKDGAQLICTGGVRVEKNSSLTIYAQSDGDNCGKLEATNSEYSGYAGIGSAANTDDGSGMGTLVIHGGVVSATGNSGGAGIGGGENRGFESDGGVTIYGGKVTANGGSGGAGIGGGDGGHQTGMVRIYGGEITATGGTSGAGIGGGDGCSAEKIEIYGGKVNAFGGEKAAGIGGGEDGGISSTSGYVYIYGGEVYAKGDESSILKKGGAGIGGGYEGSQGGPVMIYDGKVTAIGGGGAAGIGGGNTFSVEHPSRNPGGPVTIKGGYVIARSGGDGAGIGGGTEAPNGEIRIEGGTVEAYGKKWGPGIGYGGSNEYGVSSPPGQIIISGGEVKAYADSEYTDAAGIGGGRSRISPEVLIKGGKVEAKGGICAIGDGKNAGGKYTSGLDIDAELSVEAGEYYTVSNLILKSEQINACRNNLFALIRACQHEGADFNYYDEEQHEVVCQYCNTFLKPHVFDEQHVCTICYNVTPLLLSDNLDNTQQIQAVMGEIHDVAIKDRVLRSGVWNTLCLPYGLGSFTGTPLENADVRTLESTELADGILTLNFSKSSLTSIEAGKPYLVSTNGEDILTLMFEKAEITASTPVNSEFTLDEATKLSMKGTYAPIVCSEENKNILYVGSDGLIHYADATTSINSFRAYFEVESAESGSGEGAAGVKAFVLNFNGSESTGISSVKTATGDADDAWYDLSGRRISVRPSAPGIYIHGGKKMVVR